MLPNKCWRAHFERLHLNNINIYFGRYLDANIPVTVLQGCFSKIKHAEYEASEQSWDILRVPKLLASFYDLLRPLFLPFLRPIIAQPVLMAMKRALSVHFVLLFFPDPLRPFHGLNICFYWFLEKITFPVLTNVARPSNSSTGNSLKWFWRKDWRNYLKRLGKRKGRGRNGFDHIGTLITTPWTMTMRLREIFDRSRRRRKAPVSRRRNTTPRGIGLEVTQKTVPPTITRRVTVKLEATCVEHAGRRSLWKWSGL